MKRWRRPASDFPDRKHAAGVASAFALARAESRRKDAEFYDQLTENEQGGENEEN